MNDLRQAAQQALEALESWERVAPDLSLPEYDRAIITLRATLEQQQAEPGQMPNDMAQQMADARHLERFKPRLKK